MYVDPETFYPVHSRETGGITRPGAPVPCDYTWSCAPDLRVPAPYHRQPRAHRHPGTAPARDRTLAAPTQSAGPREADATSRVGLGECTLAHAGVGVLDEETALARAESLDCPSLSLARASGDQWGDQCRHADPLGALQLADGEALSAQQVEGVAVAVTAVGECPPWIVEPVLPSLKARTIRRANVLQEEQLTLRSQDSVDLGQAFCGSSTVQRTSVLTTVSNDASANGSDSALACTTTPTCLEARSRRSSRGSSSRSGSRENQFRDRVAVVLNVETGSSADLQNAPAGGRQKTAATVRHPPSFRKPQEGVVQKRKDSSVDAHRVSDSLCKRASARLGGG